MTTRLFTLLLLISPILMTACASTGGGYNSTYGTASEVPRTPAIDTSTERALADAEASGNMQEVLAVLKRLHDENPNDAVVAARYARALRDDDQISASARILTPYTKGKTAHEAPLTEMAMTQLALGNFRDAENYAKKALSIDDTNPRAYLALGTALDAQKEHQQAEVAFRNGLKHWKGDATPILNNLALNLASQGHLVEALSLIEKAQEIEPDRLDLERNRRIIATLLETTGPQAPAPSSKPTLY
jgi:Flp pilus assembly protein TadD